MLLMNQASTPKPVLWHHLHLHTINWIHKLTSHLNLMDGYEVVELEEQGLCQPGKSSDKFFCVFEGTGLSRNKTKFKFSELKKP